MKSIPRSVRSWSTWASRVPSLHVTRGAHQTDRSVTTDGARDGLGLHATKTAAPIAHAAAQTRGPVSQGLVAMVGPLIDTILVCSITALVILTSGAWTSGETGAALTGKAFELALPGVGH